MGMGRHDLIDNRTAMPRGIVNDDHHFGGGLSRVGSGNIVYMSHKSHLEPTGFALTRLPLDSSRLFQQPGGQFATGGIEGGVTLHQILIVPGPHPGPMPLDSEGGAKGRGQRKACFILTEQHALAEFGFFLTRRSPLGRFVAFAGRLGGIDR
jgi:hypothetical protein